MKLGPTIDQLSNPQSACGNVCIKLTVDPILLCLFLSKLVVF